MESIGVACFAAVAMALAAFSFSACAEDESALRKSYELVRNGISWESFTSISPRLQHLLVRIAEQGDDFKTNGMPCFYGDVPQDVVAYVSAAYQQGLQKYNTFSPWSVTASNPGGITALGQTVLTYSFVPDGTIIPEDPELGNGAQPSNLFSTFNTIFAGESNPTAAWQELFHQVFAAWGEQIGVSYVFEPNDDGGAFAESGVTNGSPGVLGVRGDIRISGYNIDGAGAGILAFNFFPDSGDMVIDTTNSSFYAESANNYRFARNVFSHEHGHGLGFAHSCPLDQTKLMEPFLSTVFDGPQLDDVLAGQLRYGDPLEAGADTPGVATDLGTVSELVSTVSDVSISAQADDDFYTLDIPGTAEVTITVTPAGDTYLSGEQLGNGDCEAGAPFNTSALLNLDFEVLAANGVTILETASSTAAGNAESFSETLGAGTYFVRVFSNTADFDVQAYTISALSGEALPGNITSDVALDFIESGVTLNLSGPAGSNYLWMTEPGMVPVDGDGGRITGLTSQTLHFDPVLESDSGTYRVQYDNGAKTVVLSNPLTFTVLPSGSVPVAGVLGILLLGSGVAGAGVMSMRRRKNR